MMKHHCLSLKKTAVGVTVAAAACASLSAGQPVVSAETSGADAFDWCEWLKNKPGLLYSDKSNPWVQEFQLEGRLQYQMAYVDGEDVSGADFSSRFNEFRRFRLGAKTKFLQYFGAKVSADLVGDERIQSEPNSGLGWGYEQLDEALVSVDLGKMLGGGPFDSLMLNYGRHKFVLGQEARTSSTKLLTVERSAISNKVYGSARPTGLSVDAVLDDWSLLAAVFSSTTDGDDNQALSGWQDGMFGMVGATYQVSDALKVGADLVYNDADVAGGEDSVLSYEWAASLNAEYNAGSWGVITDLIYGDNGSESLGHSAESAGSFHGLVVMPYYWVVPERVQLVGQYQYAGSEGAEGLRINSRYGRARGTGGLSGIDVNSGRGDEHHSLYAGVNWYLCGHNAKIQTGVEYQTMDTPAGDFDTLTYLLAFRTYF